MRNKSAEHRVQADRLRWRIMKKITAIILALSMLIFLASCGNDNQPQTTTTVQEFVTEGISSAEQKEENTSGAEEPETSSTSENVNGETTKAESTTENTTKVASDVSFPIVNKSGNGTLTINKNGTYSYDSGTVSLNNSVIGTVYGSVTATGSYKVSGDNFSLDYGVDSMTLHCNKEDNSQLNAFYKAFIPKLNGAALTNHSSASVSGGKLVIKMISYNGTDEYKLTTHTFTADETEAILALGK